MKEWIELMKKAKELGFSKQEVMELLSKMKGGKDKTENFKK